MSSVRSNSNQSTCLGFGFFGLGLHRNCTSLHVLGWQETQIFELACRIDYLFEPPTDRCCCGLIANVGLVAGVVPMTTLGCFFESSRENRGCFGLRVF